MNSNEISTNLKHAIQKMLESKFANETKKRSKVFSAKVGELLERIPVDIFQEIDSDLNDKLYELEKTDEIKKISKR